MTPEETSNNQIVKYDYPLDNSGEYPPNKPLIIPDCPNPLPRKCTKCGKWHDTGIQDAKIGRMIERFDLCYDCWWEKKLKNA